MINREPIASPAAWRGLELFQSELWGTKVPPDAISRTGDLSDEFRQLLSKVQDRLETGPGAVLIKGFPLEEFEQDSVPSIFLQVCQAIGTPVSQTPDGDRVFSVRNEGYLDSDPRARGPNTRKKLTFHTDRCDVIAFLCLQPAKEGGENQVVSSVSVYNEILRRRPDLLEVLMQPFYYQRHNVDQANKKPFIQQPIFSVFEGFFAANFLRVLIERAYKMPELPDMTPLQKEALDLVEEIAGQPELNCTFTQSRGDILLLNNWVTFHRRNEFVDHQELNKRRHLLRAWLSVPNSRPLDPVFAGNYGATEAGAIRGGMPEKEK